MSGKNLDNGSTKADLEARIRDIEQRLQAEQAVNEKLKESNQGLREKLTRFFPPGGVDIKEAMARAAKKGGRHGDAILRKLG